MSQVQENAPFFQVGGTLPPTATYVERAADEQLRQATLNREYCNVLTARQMGKSSLMVRTVDRLRKEGIHTAALDLTDIGVKLSANEWYFGLVSRLKDALSLTIDEREWWQQRSQQSVVQRFSDFLRDVILEEIKGSVVIFVDEIDSTLSLPFADDFFASIRAAYNARASDPIYKRLTFVLLGVAWPGDLIKDRTRTPYNIGTSIDLTDFTFEEAKSFLPGLEQTDSAPARAETILEEVLYWTGGHPYLTQKVCAEITKSPKAQWTAEKINELVKRLFLSDEARKESNLQYINDRIQQSSDRESLLRRYRRVLMTDDKVPDEERDPLNSQLKLAGLVKVVAGHLVVRNRIYEAVFDPQWIKDNLPTFTAKRVTAIAVAVAIVALLAGGLFFYFQPNSAEVQAQTLAQSFQESQNTVI